ncbi:MAG: hypothetical protein JST54_01990 [Deltaproteobacteria bacterium]|nr:hypothetical protein [Deltaproteobacteria bacterium]
MAERRFEDPEQLKAWLAVRSREAAGELRTEALALFQALRPLPTGASLPRRLGHSLALPFALLGHVWRNPALRRAYLRATVPVAALTLLIGIAGGIWWYRDQELDAEAPDKDGVTVVIAGKPLVHLVDQTLKAHEAAKAKKAGAPDAEDELDEAARDVEVAADDAEDARRAQQRAKVAWGSALYGALVLVEACLLALARDHQDQLTRAVALASGAPPDDPERTPRIRLDVRWVLRKIKRRFIGLMIFTCCLLPATVFGPFFGRWGAALLTSTFAVGWGAYWASVFALGRSKLAWTHALPGEPWFLQLEQRLGSRAWMVSWFGPRLYVRVLRRVTRSVAPATLAFERAHVEGLGLGLGHAICGLPVLNALTRPVFAVAATHALIPHLVVEATEVARGATDDPSRVA